MGIKVIHQIFSDEEYAKLLKAKGDKTWRELILELTTPTLQGGINNE